MNELKTLKKLIWDMKTKHDARVSVTIKPSKKNMVCYELYVNNYYKAHFTTYTMMSCAISYLQRLYDMDTFFYMNKDSIKNQITEIRDQISSDQEDLKQLELKYKKVCEDVEILEKLEKL